MFKITCMAIGGADLTNAHAMLIVILIWAVIAMHALGILPNAIDNAITYMYSEQHTCGKIGDK